jgi:hypothetical protein
MTLGSISAHTASAGKPFPKNGRCWMPMFTFEIVRHDKAPAIADVLRLPDERTIWCRAEALALRIENRDSAFIRVKNSEGATVVRTGVATALASIEKCSCVACPLKRELERRVSAGASRRN